MKWSIRAGVACVFVGVSAPLWAAAVSLPVAPLPRIASGVVETASLAGCDWNSRITKQLIKDSDGRVHVSEAAAARHLDIEVVKLVAPPAGDRDKRVLGVNAKVWDAGKLLAKRYFEDRSISDNTKPICDQISRLAANLGGDIAGWLEDSPLPVCGDACTGLQSARHAIAVGSDFVYAMPNVGQGTEAARACPWGKSWIQTLAEWYEDDDGSSSRLKLVITDQDIQTYTGPKLVLKVVAMHVVPGGMFAGDKWVSIRGELIEGGMTWASFYVTERTSRGSSSSVCAALDVLGGRVFDRMRDYWLDDPKLNADLTKK